MEQAHTQLIAQLNERILAADNTPLYIKFAETVKNAVRSGVLEHGNILPLYVYLFRRFRALRCARRCRRWKKRVW